MKQFPSWDQGWQLLDSAPKDGTRVDLWIDGERVTDCWFDKGCWLMLDDGCEWSAGDPTYWMLPPPPPA